LKLFKPEIFVELLYIFKTIYSNNLDTSSTIDSSISLRPFTPPENTPIITKIFNNIVELQFLIKNIYLFGFEEIFAKITKNLKKFFVNNIILIDQKNKFYKIVIKRNKRNNYKKGIIIIIKIRIYDQILLDKRFL
jgi:hypothetical protein